MINKYMQNEANQFAMALLMPEDLVKKEILKMKDFDFICPDDLKSLAAKFAVHTQIMAFRLGQLGLTP